MTTTVSIVRRSARALLLDDNGRLVTIKRIKPGQAPHWTTAGGGMEPRDASREATVVRELREEVGAVVIWGSPAFPLLSGMSSVEACEALGRGWASAQR